MKYGLILMAFLSFAIRAQVPPFYQNLSKQTNVPVEVLFALASTETDTLLDNGKILPWPYSINLNGTSEYFATSAGMLARARELIGQHIIHFDCGLFQVNWKWNGRYRAKNISEACLPKSNGRIASDIIKEYFAKTGSWVESAGKYHNPSNKNGAADNYKLHFIANLKRAQRMIYGDG